ncbi:MAG: DNA replication/repair protein RecF [Bacteroidetes bacterium]|nr:DNA replication/repair protein RecF [Bacteroidota bacterium]MBK9633675.1 DNA replication/repair protein RecF [Bacteroidota bacterium]MBL0287171.1 DNA replication/repair protein RecF [Bacteroidota bacterium]MBP7256611.1 DNA replication/repair protein RecF [Chitinophagales bacterium]
MDKKVAYIESIKGTNYRNYDFFQLVFSKKINFITGKNGEGKTNILDSIYFSCFTKSYFNSSDNLTIKNGTNFLRMETFAKSDGLEYKIVLKSIRGKKKEFELNGDKVEKFSNWIGKLPCVLIAPNDIELIFGGSEVRRKFLDATLAQVDKSYLLILTTYNRYLLQRNSVLKNYFRGENIQNSILIEAYNDKLLEYGTKIYHLRRNFLNAFLDNFNAIYVQIAGKDELATLTYESDMATNDYLSNLNRVFEKDRVLQRTTIGVHGDDLILELNGLSLKKTASQGQQKTFLLALKLAQYFFIKEKLNVMPILLLDDIFDKFDEQRSKFLLDLVFQQKFGQVFITDANETRMHAYLERMADYKVFHVQNLQIEERIGK